MHSVDEFDVHREECPRHHAGVDEQQTVELGLDAEDSPASRNHHHLLDYERAVEGHADDIERGERVPRELHPDPADTDPHFGEEQHEEGEQEFEQVPLDISSVRFGRGAVELVGEDGGIEVAVVENELEVLVGHAHANQDVESSDCVGESVQEAGLVAAKHLFALPNLSVIHN